MACPLGTTLVLPDSNIWASSTLHAWFALIGSSEHGVWTICVTEDIIAEAIRARRKRFPRSSSRQIELLRRRIVQSIGDNFITDFLIDETVIYHDEGDAHVHSAALHGHVDHLVTNNTQDFQGLYSDPDLYPYEIFTADEWLTMAFQLNPTAVQHALWLQCEYLRSRSSTVSITDRLKNAGCPEFASLIRSELELGSYRRVGWRLR